MRKIATGGMAEIYLARITGAAGFEKLVVLKRILPTVAEDPQFVHMFLDEARLAATLRHPNIADVYDVGESDGSYFFTMEYVHGQDVRAIRHEAKKRAEHIPIAIALAVIHGAASALDHAHEKLGPDGTPLGLVHRDVSASNVMVSYDGAVKLLDFGIARATSSTHKTQTGTLKGKVPYMSPEQCRGLGLDRRSDLFSLGVVMYELTVGRRPFRGDSDFAIMDQIVYHGAQPPSQLVQGYPPQLEAIVMKLLERGPSQRYATGEEMLHELDEFIATHGLWLSSRAIGKYMRTVFHDKIEAWEQAQQEGVPFTQHVVHTITSQSQRSELLTPPSEFAAIEPRSTSQRMVAAAPPAGPLSQPMAVFQPIVPVRRSSVVEAAEEVPSRISYPALPRRSWRGLGLALVGVVILGAGGVAGFVLSRKDAPAAAMTGGTVEMVKPGDSPKPEAADDVKHMSVVDGEKPADEATQTPAANGAKPANEAKQVPVADGAKPAAEPTAPKPSSFEPVASEPTVPDTANAATKPKSDATATKPKSDAAPKTAAAATKPKSEPVATKPKAKPTVVVRPKPKKPEAKPDEAKKPEPAVEEKPKTWDPNSPVLPQ